VAYPAELRAVVIGAVALLRELGDEASTVPRAEGAWTPREIIGHLIDSASNNHHRFVRAQLSDGLVFAGYEQEGWVRVQDYANAPWDELIVLWASFNLHLARVMENAPPEARMRKHTRHTLHHVAWTTVPESEAATLDYLMHDYVHHLEHHLKQIFGSTADDLIGLARQESAQ